jgi:hypothetical protein
LYTNENLHSIYERVINSISDEEAGKINVFLQQILVMSEDIMPIIANLKSEQNLPEECMRNILTSLIHRDITTSYCFKDEYNEICKKFYLKGRTVQGLKINYFGNATFKKYLINQIVKANDDENTSELQGEIEEYIEELIRGDIPETEDLKNFFIDSDQSRMWATWADTRDGNPFDFLKTRNLRTDSPSFGSPYEVRLSLALGYDRLSKNCGSMLLLTYNSDKIGELHVPTIADAGYYKYFLPSPHDSNHGWTQPSHPELQQYYINQLEQSGHMDYNNKPRPEAVHRPITLGCLCKVEELTF